MVFKSYINVKYTYSLAHLKNKEDICIVSETWQWMIYDYIFLDYKRLFKLYSRMLATATIVFIQCLLTR